MVKVSLSLRSHRMDVGEAPSVTPKAELDLERLSRNELTILLANLRRSGRTELAKAIARELDFAAVAPSRGPDVRPPGQERQPSASGANRKRTAAVVAGAVALAACGLIAVMMAPELRTRPAPGAPPEASRQAQHAMRGPATETASVQARRTNRSTLPVRRAATGPADSRPGNPLRAATPSTPIVVAEAVQPSEAQPERIALPAIDAVALAATDPPSSGPAPPPVIVSQGDLGRLLGRAPQRSDPLRSLHSGNPVRMATAVSAAR